MDELALSERRAIQVPIIKLILRETSVPEDAFPTEELLILPTYARLTVKNGTLHIDVVLRDADADERDGLPDFNQSNTRVLPLSLPREKVVRLLVRSSWTRSPYVELFVRDPGGVYDELYFLFGPWSSNNPHYHIDAFAKMLKDEMGISIKYEEQPPEPEWPF